MYYSFLFCSCFLDLMSRQYHNAFSHTKNTKLSIINHDIYILKQILLYKGLLRNFTTNAQVLKRHHVQGN